MNRLLPLAACAIFIFIFFWQFFLKGFLPIPADTIIGLYHPFRDFYSKDYPNGIPFKNSLITDPVRQQYPWKKLVIDELKKGKLPIWNPYEMSGKPLLANFQAGTFYPLNLLFFFLPFNLAWSFFIISQPFLAILFTFLFLQNLKLSKTASLLGGFVFAFCGFSVAWLEWGNIVNTALWLPLILLSVDKIVEEKRSIRWTVLLSMSLVFSLMAGHLQVFFYLFLTFFFYTIFRLNQNKYHNFKFFLAAFLAFLGVSLVQLAPTFKFIGDSARTLDQSYLSSGWFMPWQNLVQFLAPDFFGNPATLNYWGVWNYGEFIGYIGIFPLILSMLALFYKKDKNVLFFGIIFFISLFFALPNAISKLPFIFNIPFISSSQPTRLIFLIDFSLSILCAIGYDYLIKSKKEIFYILSAVSLIFISLWIAVFKLNDPNIGVARQNLVLPTGIFATTLIFILLVKFKRNFTKFVVYGLLLLTIFDLLRFFGKFTPFTKGDYLFPQTKSIEFLKNQKGQFRIMEADSRILPPNFSSIYKIQDIDGYDPLYSERYAELIAASERGRADIKPPFGFNRIITPHSYTSKIIDLLGVKYILSLNDISLPNLSKVFQEGETRIYQNKNFLPRVFFVSRTIFSFNKTNSIEKLFKNINNLSDLAIVEGLKDSKWSKGSIEVLRYDNNSVMLKTQNPGDGFLILTDSYYPAWHASIDGREVKILRTDFNFRGIPVPSGTHTINFYINLL